MTPGITISPFTNRSRELIAPAPGGRAGQGGAALAGGPGVELDNRLIPAERAGLLLVDSGFSEVQPGTADWLRGALDRRSPNIVFTHTPSMSGGEAAHPVGESGQRPEKYVMSKSPELFGACLSGRADWVYCGHLHFDGRVDVGGTAICSSD